MKKKFLILPVIAALMLAGAGIASAHGGFLGRANQDPVAMAENFDNMMTRDAEILGISVEEMKNAWSQGKNLRELAEEKGISEEQIKEKMRAERQAEMKNRLNALVSQGKITQDQADSRLKFMEENTKNQTRGFGEKRGMGRGGFMGM